MRQRENVHPSGPAFWQSATIALALSACAAAAIFGFVIGLADGSASLHEASPNHVFAIVAVILAVIAAGLAWRRTPTTVGAAVGVFTAGVLVAFVCVANA
ncbi:hypothetical protein [Nocardia camponoti]|uniref:Uncharacterized protein n=1 Tax=Nocardia camponoti TaxID=1616106 RepID=A0A917VC70_9NOCA|nr:hypothetical protein [Nocardia camponoti]GGK61759.1 hypothetical protein GCM10011591_37540 [Nocardia camponoti]